MKSFTQQQAATVASVIAERRDMRHFNNKPMEPGVLDDILLAGHLAPSVGFMQPWRFIKINSKKTRAEINKLVRAEQELTANALPTRGDELRGVKIDGINECAELVVVCLTNGRDKHILGKRTMPSMDMASAGCAIQNMWLQARAHNVGLGWVSFYDPNKLAALLNMPPDAMPVAVLCIGPVDEFYPKPMFELAGWGARLPLDKVIYEDAWPAGDTTTPTAY